MTDDTTSRRALLALGLGGAAFAAVQPMAALAQPVPIRPADIRISRIDIDTRPIAPYWGPNTAIVEREMLAVLREQFDSRLVPRGGARLVVVVRQIFLNAFTSGTTSRGGRSAGNEADDMTSEAVILDGRGGVIAETRVLSVLNSSSGGAWYLEDNDQRRLAALARQNAWWVKVQLVGRG